MGTRCQISYLCGIVLLKADLGDKQKTRLQESKIKIDNANKMIYVGRQIVGTKMNRKCPYFSQTVRALLKYYMCNKQLK